jgi:hypothetical protein
MSAKHRTTFGVMGNALATITFFRWTIMQYIDCQDVRLPYETPLFIAGAECSQPHAVTQSEQKGYPSWTRSITTTSTWT